ncbi:MAG: cytidine deaminase [Alphaproteobacteria bacterium]|nr:cytidine deaminase [Alphaproteobacteria bacterium]
MNNEQKLYNLAQKARENAYAPYSEFKVGAAILTANGNFYSGCNVENASYPCGTCAEAGAVSAMICGGDDKISEILIMADADEILPCGNCLQKIAEFSSGNTVIYSADLNKIVHKYKLRYLLPHKFSAKDL